MKKKNRVRAFRYKYIVYWLLFFAAFGSGSWFFVNIVWQYGIWRSYKPPTIDSADLCIKHSPEEVSSSTHYVYENIENASKKHKDETLLPSYDIQTEESLKMVIRDDDPVAIPLHQAEFQEIDKHSNVQNKLQEKEKDKDPTKGAQKSIKSDTTIKTQQVKLQTIDDIIRLYDDNV